VCNGVKEVRAYAYGNLLPNDGRAYYALAEALDANGDRIAYAMDTTAADGIAGEWQNAGDASYIRTTGWVYGTEVPQPCQRGAAGGSISARRALGVDACSITPALPATMLSAKAVWSGPSAMSR
jgi:hypothetical protein